VTGAVRLTEIVREWARVNGGELNRSQTRELLRALDLLALAETDHAAAVRKIFGR
jgi:hypothetical protein